MVCKYFGKCGSCTLYNLNYAKQKDFKILKTNELFGFLHAENIAFFDSPKKHYRTRAEFMIWHDNDDISYAMHGLKKGEIVKIEDCPKVCKNIYNAMPKFLACIKNNQILRNKLFGVEFLSTKEDLLLTLLYHRKIDEIWEIEAKKLAEELDIKIIGRSRGLKKVISENFIYETLHVKDKDIKYKIYDVGFVQPNTYVNEKMIEFVLNSLNKDECKDLLELYSGHGNFTLPLSFYFENILATEISKMSIKSALFNTRLNNIKNITFLRFSAKEFVDAINKVRDFKRLKDVDLSSYNFTHILVDPPRAGLDDISLKLVQQFKNIVYISCSQETLKRDLVKLLKTHEVFRFALFDQFPYTLHVESGIILKRK